MLISLKGKNDIYSFDPQNEADKIYTKGKFSNIYRGNRISDNSVVTIKHIKEPNVITGERHEQLLMQLLSSFPELHSGLAQTYDLIKSDAGYFLIREYLRGADLKTITIDPDYPHLRNPVFMLKVGIQLCEILQALHSSGIIHRDIKPSNVFIESQENGEIDPENFTVKLIDFELSQVKGASLFKLKKVPFAMVFSAPELVLRRANLVNESTDVYSLGVTLYEAIARRPAFYHENPEMLINIQLNNPIVRVPRLPREIFPVLLKATSKHKFPIPPNRYKPENLEFFLAKGREDRYQSAGDFKIALEEVLQILENKANKKNKGNFFTRLFNVSST